MYYILHPHFAHLSKALQAKEEQILPCDFHTFPDGFPNYFLPKYEKIENNTITMIGDFSSKEHIFDSICLMQGILDYHPKELHVWVPYFPTATMERADIFGEIASAHTLLQMIGSVKKGSTRLTLHMLDLHDQRIALYGPKDISIKLHSFIPYALEHIAKPQNLHIAFPDSGAYKRYRGFVSQFKNIIVCNKVRKGDSRVIDILDGEAKNKDILIIDDLIRG